MLIYQFSKSSTLGAFNVYVGIYKTFTYMFLKCYVYTCDTRFSLINVINVLDEFVTPDHLPICMDLDIAQFMNSSPSG